MKISSLEISGIIEVIFLFVTIKLSCKVRLDKRGWLMILLLSICYDEPVIMKSVISGIVSILLDIVVIVLSDNFKLVIIGLLIILLLIVWWEFIESNISLVDSIKGKW
jgi:hypothetical protein